MATVDVWGVVHPERSALADELSALREEQWSTPSLCSGWTVRDVVAHMAATASITPLSFFPKFIGSGFKFERVQAKGIAEQRGADPDETLAHFRAIVTSTKRPPGPKDTILGETILHSEDVRRPLGVAHSYSPDALVEVADFYKGSNLVLGTKRRIEGLSLRATDSSWSHGSGPEVSGPMLPLLLAMTGRKAGLDELSGEGLATLRARD
jgi:uncharacterized protein (TIGR03083 family)